MSLTDLEIAEVKFRLGYGTLGVGSLPYINGTLIFEQVVQANVNAFGEARIRDTTLPNLRTLEAEIFSARNTYGIKELVGDVVFDTTPGSTKAAQLLAQQEFWLRDLESITRVPRAQPASSTSTVSVS